MVESYPQSGSGVRSRHRRKMKENNDTQERQGDLEFVG